MFNLQASLSDKDQSVSERITQLGQRMIAPHPSIIDLSVRRRVQLLNATTIILTLSFVIGLLAQPASITTFEFMLFISVCSYLLGKSKYPGLGTFLFSFGFLSTTYLTLYLGLTNDYSASVLSIVPIALIAASTLTSQRTFAGLSVYAIFATFFASSYSTTPIASDDSTRVGGIVLFISAVLYGVNTFRLSIENARLRESRAANQNLQDVKANLEGRVKEHAQQIDDANQQIQQRAKRLYIISEISREITASINTSSKELLTHITQTVSQQFGYYHVGIFLVEKNRQYAELHAANSQGGQHMLERRHQLKVGGTGIVGYVSQSGYPRIALSTGADAVFFNNPDLPETKSEMALPLKIGNQVIGVLDIQSVLPAAFNEEDTNTFNILASQIALAIQNTQSVDEQSTQTVRKFGAFSNSVNKQNGYVYLSDGTISSAQTLNNPILNKALASGETIATPSSSKNAVPILAVPVKIRDNVIGYIHIESGEVNRKWTEDEIAMVQSVSERAALALENARLFEETEHRAEQEQIMARMTSRIGESTSFERILQTTIQEIGRALGAKRTFIQLKTPSSDEDAGMDQGI